MDHLSPDRIEALRSAFAALPDRTRQVFRLHALEGEDYASVARRLGIAPAEVEARIVETLLALGRAFDPEM